MTRTARFNLPDTAFDILVEAAAFENEYVWGSPNIKTRVYHILKAACDACDIPYGRGLADGIVVHDARHTVTTELLNEGLDRATVQEMSGWSEREFLLWYSHSTPGSRARAAEVMERISGSGGQTADKPVDAGELSGSH